MTSRVRPALFLALFATASAASAATRPVAPRTPRTPREEPSLRSLRSLREISVPCSAWSLPAGAIIDGDRLIVDLPPGSACRDARAFAEIDIADAFAAMQCVAATVAVRGVDVSEPPHAWQGVKVQLSYTDYYGDCVYRDASLPRGSFDWTNVTVRVSPLLAPLGIPGGRVSLLLGLEGCTGRAEFDLSTLRIDREDTGIPREDDVRKVRCPSCREGERNAPHSRILRGCMLPARATTEEDIRDLADWGATLVRFQITRDFGKIGANSDLVEYAEWIDSRLDNLADVLRWAEARGMKVCVDLHSTPGGIRAGDRATAMLYDERFADAYVETWRRIATRCAPAVQTVCAPAVQTAGPAACAPAVQTAGPAACAPAVQTACAPAVQTAGPAACAPAVQTAGPTACAPAVQTAGLYGYDLVNEPKQVVFAPVNYWEIQRRAAEAIRAIDPVTPIIVESNISASPMAFAYLQPLPIDNVIYQLHMYAPGDYTHQGVGRPLAKGNRPLVWPDPSRGWDIEYLRRALEPVRAFQRRHGARIYVGEFSAAAWAPGADRYLRDCISLFEEYGWDWTYHAFREWGPWSVEHEVPGPGRPSVPSADNPRKRALLDGLKGRTALTSGPACPALAAFP